jgi:hypothetical protein
MRRISRVSVGLAVAGLAAAGVAVVPQLGSAAPAKATTHTLKLVATETASHSVGRTRFLGADTDRNPSTHKVVGYDSITGRFNAKTGVVKIDAAVALKGGIITAHLVGQGQTNAFDGKITGGTGSYRGIHGTIQTTGKGKKTFITFKYHR